MAKTSGYFLKRRAVRAGYSLPVLSGIFLGLCFNLPAYSATEFGVKDDVTVMGVDGTVPDPNLEVKGFSIFGSTNLVTHISTAPGNTVFNGAVEVSSDIYVVGISTFTGPVTITNAGRTATYFFVRGDGNVGVGTASPAAVLHIKAGTTAAGTAPLKFTTQADGLSSAEQGAMELIGNSLQFTQLAKRRGVAMTQDVLTADTTVGNTTNESAALITSEHGAGYLEAGKSEEIVLRGTIQQTNVGSGQLYIRVKYAGAAISITTTTIGNIAAGTPFEIRVTATCRSVGAAGTMQVNSVLWIDGAANIPDSATLAAINTTTAQNTTITAQWTVADAGNTMTVNQGRVLCIEPNR